MAPPSIKNDARELRMRVLFVKGREWLGARGNKVFSSLDQGKSWKRIATLAMDFPFSIAHWWRPLHRLTRAEVYKLQACGDYLVALAKGGVYAGKREDGTLRLSFRVTRGSRPISLAANPSGEVFFGEYHDNAERGPMKIYGTVDFKTWRVAHEFPAGEIRHIHGIFFDKFENCFWVLTGDRGNEAGILRFSADFSHGEWVHRGDQSVRVVSVVCLENGLFFPTDTEIERNAAYFMERSSRKLTRLRDLESSSFNATKVGDWLLLSTVTEPSKVNTTPSIHLWATRDMRNWKKLAEFEKDSWPYLFQYGNASFPEGETEEMEEVVFSGTAVKQIDNRAWVLPVRSLESNA